MEISEKLEIRVIDGRNKTLGYVNVSRKTPKIQISFSESEDIAFPFSFDNLVYWLEAFETARKWYKVE